MEPAAESESQPGALHAAARPPHSQDSGAALGGARTRRRPASQRVSEGGRRAGPGPSCPYDRAGRRRALPSHGKLRPRRRRGLGLGRELGGGRSPSKPTASARRLPRLSSRGRGLRLPAHLCVRSDCRRGGVALGLTPEAALQLLLGLRRFPGEGKAAHPIARRGTLSHSLAREREVFAATGRGSMS